MLEAVNLNVARIEEIHEAPLANDIAPPLYFNSVVRTKNRVAEVVRQRPRDGQDHLSMNRHPPTQAAFDNGNGSCHGRNSSERWPSHEGLPSRNPAASHGGVLYRLPSHHTIFRCNVLIAD